VERP